MRRENPCDPTHGTPKLLHLDYIAQDVLTIVHLHYTFYDIRICVLFKF